MSKRSKGKQKERKRRLLFLIALIIAAFAVSGMYLFGDFFTGGGTTTAPSVQIPLGDNIEIHFIDVGQGDGALIKTPAGNVIIDSGPKSQSNSFIKYLKDQGVEKIEYAIFTHPHEDHMGSAQFVLDEFEVGRVIMNDRITTSQYFESALDTIERNDIDVVCAKVGDVYRLGDLKMTVIAPNSSKYGTNDANNSSIMIYLEYGDTSVIFTGDAEKESEYEVVNKYGAGMLDCDLLKIAHHGSTSSNTAAFLACVTPEYAVISVGADNSYGHPEQEVLERLEGRGIIYYTTENEGSIVFVSDGKVLTKR